MKNYYYFLKCITFLQDGIICIMVVYLIDKIKIKHICKNVLECFRKNKK